MKLKEQLTSLLQDRDWTAAQLARRSGVSKQVLSQWLNGAAPRKIDQVKKVADTLGVSVDQLCFGATTKADIKSPFNGHEREIECGLFEVVLRRPKRT